MLSLTVVSRSQWAQWFGIAAWVFFLQDSFNAKVFPDSAKPEGIASEVQKFGIGLYAACIGLDFVAVAQFASAASQRKAIQYSMAGYIALIAMYVYDGTVEANLRVVAWAMVNLLFLIIAVYVWHKDEKNDGARTDCKLTTALRIHYLVWLVGFFVEVSGYAGEMLKDPSALQAKSAGSCMMCLGATLRIFSIMGGFAVAQVNADDQKKAVQYKMATIFLGLLKVSHMSIEINPKYFDWSIGLMAILLQTLAWLTYGGSCQKSVIRLFYTVELFMGYIGLVNTPLYISQFFPHTSVSVDAGLYIATMQCFIGLMFVAASQMDAAGHRKILQYGIAAMALRAGVLHSSQNVVSCKLICSIIWAVVFTCVVYPKELGLSNLPVCPFAILNRITSGSGAGGEARSRSSSPKRATGRSATPGKKSQKKKKN